MDHITLITKRRSMPEQAATEIPIWQIVLAVASLFFLSGGSLVDLIFKTRVTNY